MEKVLIIANEFPPMGGAGVQRTTKFVKYLPKFAYDPVVVTKIHHSSLEDITLLDELPKDLKIHRLKAYDTVNKKGPIGLGLKFLGTRVLSPDSEFFWYLFNRKKLVDLVEKEDIKLIYTTSFPYSSHLLGLYLKRMFPNIKWVVDFRDEWTNNPYHLDYWYKRIKFKREKKKELEITNECDYLVTNTPFMLENFIKDNPSLRGKSSFIPNGYDEEDFAGLNEDYPRENKFIITYTGSLYGRRNLDEFLDGLKIGIDRGEIDKSKLEIRIVGNIYKEVLDQYGLKYGLEDNIKVYGYLAHKDSIEMLLKSDILLLVIGKGKGSRNFYTGKIFEYIKANKPILAIVPKDGAAAQVINETKTGRVIDPEDIQGVGQALGAYYKSWLEGEEVHQPNWKEIEKYSRESQAEDLSEIFNKLI